MAVGGSRTARRVPEWPEVRRLLDLGDPQVVLIEGEVAIELRVDGEQRAVSLRCPVREAVDLRTFGAPEELVVRNLADPDPRLEVSVADVELLPYFLGFVETVVDRVQLGEAEAVEALQTSMRLFRRLLRDVRLVSREKVLGLLGELWVLNRLIDSAGADALDAWIGPRGEAHDFRSGGFELEVKTTARQRRVHSIHGLDQLEPSPDAKLCLVSVQLAAGGRSDDSFSLAERLTATAARLEAGGRAHAFDQIITGRYDLPPEARDRYRDRYRLRSPSRLVPVDDSLPRLTRADLEAAGIPDSQRIVDVEYALDVEELGVADGSDEFELVLPKGAVDA